MQQRTRRRSQVPAAQSWWAERSARTRWRAPDSRQTVCAQNRARYPHGRLRERRQHAYQHSALRHCTNASLSAAHSGRVVKQAAAAARYLCCIKYWHEYRVGIRRDEGAEVDFGRVLADRVSLRGVHSTAREHVSARRRPKTVLCMYVSPPYIGLAQGRMRERREPCPCGG